ncbi:MAG: phytochelatin synthase family protein [Hyalangium sp.]
MGAVVARPLLFPRRMDVVSIKASAAYQDPSLLARAWQLPVAAEYAHAGEVFQPNVSFCGPTSAANVLRTLGHPGATPQQVLEGTGKCTLGFCWGGLTLDQLAEVVRGNLKPPAGVQVLRGLSLEEFRQHLRHVNEPQRRYIINFDRGPLFGTVGGHHSPIAGYLEQEDLVLVLDVNEKYRPWLVPTERLYQAMTTVDSSSGLQRGLLLIE